VGIDCVYCIQGKRIRFIGNKAYAESTDQLDAMTIARVLLSGEARAGYIPSDRVATSRELVRLHTQLSDEAARYPNEIQALVVVLFPEVTQVTARPCLPNALSVLKAYPHAQAIVEAGVEAIYQVLRAQQPARYGRPTEKRAGDLGEA
jgi:transposase